ncbi:Uncharacterised protein [Mycobacterium tuberculosis]|nr:Uncharacterised protein [Mycobacterium tuberculosis]
MPSSVADRGPFDRVGVVEVAPRRGAGRYPRRRPSAIIWRTVRSVTARYSAASLIVMYRRDNGGASAMPGLSVS